MIGQIQGDPRVKKLLDELQYKYELTDLGAFRLIFELEDGRSQIVVVNSTTHTYSANEIREIWSVALRQPGEINQQLANELLRANNNVALGAWRILFEEGESYVAFAVHVPAETQASFLNEMMALATFQADGFEKAYLGTDEF